MTRRCLLVNPWIHDFAAYDYWLKPLGLLQLGGVLRALGVEVTLVDCLNPRPQAGLKDPFVKVPPRRWGGHGKFPRTPVAAPSPLRGLGRPYARYGISPLFFRELLRRVPRPDAVFVTSSMTYWYPGVREAISEIRAHFGGVPVVLGGVYATLCPVHARTCGADLVLPGPVEDHLDLLLGEVLDLQVCLPFDPADLDALPYPAWDLLGYPDQLPLLTSRGCPYGCTYCASRHLYPFFRRRNPAGVLKEIRHWAERLKVRHFSVYDDAFLVAPETTALPLLEEIKNLPDGLFFHCPNGLHLREITPQIARALREANFATLRLGFETADRRRQRDTGGKASSEDLARAVAYLREAGYDGNEIGVYCLCGLPGQSAAEVRETIDLVRSLGARPIVAEYSPIPGTTLWEEALAASPYPLAEEPLFQNNTLLPCRGPDLTDETYAELKRRARQSRHPVGA